MKLKTLSDFLSSNRAMDRFPAPSQVCDTYAHMLVPSLFQYPNAAVRKDEKKFKTSFGVAVAVKRGREES